MLENDLTNERLGTLEYEFLMKILEAPRKHYVWKEAADQISLLSPGELPLVHEVLDILSKCLETTSRTKKNSTGCKMKTGTRSPTWGAGCHIPFTGFSAKILKMVRKELRRSCIVLIKRLSR